MTRRYRDQLTEAYGLFVPGSLARAKRHENAEKGLATCHNCGEAYPPDQRVATWYCSPCCARCGDPAYRRSYPRTQATDDGFSIDLTDCACAE